MRHQMHLIPCLLLAACASTFSDGGTVATERDEFTGATTVVLEDMLIPGPGRGVLYSVMLISVPGSNHARFRLKSYSEYGWKYLHCHQLAFVADSKPLEVGDVDHDGRTAGGRTVYEYVSAGIPLETVSALAVGHDSRGRICNDQFTFDLEHREQLAAFYNAVRFPDGSPVPAPVTPPEPEPDVSQPDVDAPVSEPEAANVPAE